MVVKHRNRSVDDRTNSVLGPLEVWVILLGPGHFTVPRYGSNLCPSMGEWTKKMIHTHTQYQSAQLRVLDGQLVAALDKECLHS